MDAGARPQHPSPLLLLLLLLLLRRRGARPMDPAPACAPPRPGTAVERGAEAGPSSCQPSPEWWWASLREAPRMRTRLYHSDSTRSPRCAACPLGAEPARRGRPADLRATLGCALPGRGGPRWHVWP
eukprot:scaffold48_cov395-Prasinococcus_capsulatus_cf.AAC.10